MKEKLLIGLALIIFLLISVNAWCQTSPKQHVFYDTVKTVRERVDFSPDTIPVFFKELIIGKTIVENWVNGYVVWQTYRKSDNWAGSGLRIGTGGNYTLSSQQPMYYKDEFEPTVTDTRNFLYADRKTKVINKVIFAIKR